jgi:hypothetical protein
VEQNQITQVMSLRAQRGNRELYRLDYICGAKSNNSSYVDQRSVAIANYTGWIIFVEQNQITQVMSLRAQRGNRELCMSDLHPCDCFVPRNDIVVVEKYTDNQSIINHVIASAAWQSRTVHVRFASLRLLRSSQ